jgi:uncharacterized damage-inducible protein DinB
MISATSNPVVAPIAAIFSINDTLVLRALDGLSHEEMWRAPTDHNNPMLWVAGHLVQTRATVLRQLGDSIDTGWGASFDRGASIGDADRYPARDEIERVMRDVSERLRSRLASVDDAFLTGPATIQVPGVTTMAEELAFFALHDTYHVGQMAYIRRALGYPRLVG